MGNWRCARDLGGGSSGHPSFDSAPHGAPEVSKDFRAVDSQGSSGDQDRATGSRGEQWRQVASSFLKRSAADMGEQGSMKRFRSKSLEWLVASQNQLQVMTGKGWEHFVVMPGMAPRTWPCITLAIDQGPDGWCAANFLRSQRVNFLLLRDPAHRRHNDALHALRDAGLYSCMCLLVCVLNADHAPWGEARRGFPSKRDIGVMQALICLGDFCVCARCSDGDPLEIARSVHGNMVCSDRVPGCSGRVAHAGMWPQVVASLEASGGRLQARRQSHIVPDFPGVAVPHTGRPRAVASSRGSRGGDGGSLAGR